MLTVKMRPFFTGFPGGSRKAAVGSVRSVGLHMHTRWRCSPVGRPERRSGADVAWTLRGNSRPPVGQVGFKLYNYSDLGSLKILRSGSYLNAIVIPIIYPTWFYLWCVPTRVSGNFDAKKYERVFEACLRFSVSRFKMLASSSSPAPCDLTNRHK